MPFKINFKIVQIILISICTGQCLFAQTADIQLINSVKEERKDELITLSKDFISKKLKKKLAGERIAVLNGDNQPIFVQHDDLNGDGIWDEIAFLQSFSPQEKKTIHITLNSNVQIKPVVKAHVRQKRRLPNNTFGADLERDSVPAGQPNTDFKKQQLPSMLTEGPAWENDKVGFRLYMDIRNQKDIWGKRTPGMVLDFVGTNPANTYHKLSDWGMDILIVGKSLAAGALAVNVPLAGRDTLVRLGGENMGKIIYEKVADGPVRAIFRMHYPEWDILGDGNKASLTEEISIWGGQFFYESKVTLNNAPKNTQLVTGMVNLSAKQSYQYINKKVAAVYSYDVQTDNKDKLGLAVAMPKKQWAKFGNIGDEGADIKNSYTAFGKLDKNNTAKFRFYAGWELSDNSFKTIDGFRDYIKSKSDAQASEIKIK